MLNTWSSKKADDIINIGETEPENWFRTLAGKIYEYREGQIRKRGGFLLGICTEPKESEGA